MSPEEIEKQRDANNQIAIINVIILGSKINSLRAALSPEQEEKYKAQIEIEKTNLKPNLQSLVEQGFIDDNSIEEIIKNLDY